MRVSALQIRLRTLLTIALLLLCGASTSLLAQGKCGVERWSVKVLSDQDAARVSLTPRRARIAELGAIPRPESRLPAERRVPPYEFRSYVVRAVLWRISTQDDGDWHVELRDPDTPGAMLIAELPAPECAASPEMVERFAQIRQLLRTHPRHAVVDITGVAFFDHFHNQRGRAPNGIELHPVLDISPVPLR